MTDQRVDIKVRVPLAIDTSAADSAIGKLPEKVRQAAEGIGKIGWAQPARVRQAAEQGMGPFGHPGHQAARQEIDLQTRVQQRLRESIGPQVSFLKNKKEINALYKEELAHVRSMEEELGRLKRTEHGLSSEQLRRRERDTKEARHFVNRLRDTIAVETSRESLMAGEGGGTSRGGLLDMTAQQAMNGGLIGAGIGAAGRFAMAHPVIAGAVLAAGTANWLLNKTDAVSQYSEDIDVGFTNTGRRTGLGKNLRGVFQHARPGVTDHDFKDLGYTGADLTKIVDAYGMPGSPSAVRSAVHNQAAFARAYGFGENPEAMATIGRRATQLGMAEPGQQGSFWRSMTAAVEAGMRSGVDASETMRSMMALSEQAAGHLGVLSADYKNGLAGMQAALASGDSRFFKGERGAQQVATVLDAFQNPKSIAQERFMMNAVMGAFGGRVPTAEDLGMSGSRGAAYSNMTETQKLQAVMDLMPELMAGKNKGLLASMAGQAAQWAGPGGEMPMFQALTGMKSGAMVNASAALASSVEKRFGKKRAAELDGQPLSMLAALAQEGGMPSDIAAMIRGQSADGNITKVEELRASQRELTEKSSADIAKATVEIRELGTAAKAAAEDLAALAGQSITSSDVNTNPLSGLFPSGALVLDGIRRGRHGKAEFGSSGAK